jgi:hypothetical protein
MIRTVYRVQSKLVKSAKSSIFTQNSVRFALLAPDTGPVKINSVSNALLLTLAWAFSHKLAETLKA